MRNLIVLVLIIIMVSLVSYGQVINGKFVRFGADSVIIKTDTDILNLPVSKDLTVLDNTGQKVSPASLFENANVTVKYEDGVVKSIVVDNQNVNYLQNNEAKPEYQILYREANYQQYNIQTPYKVSYVGYLPVDYQSVVYPTVDVYTAKINYYNYVPVKNSNTIGGSPALAQNIDFYNNLLANNYYSPRFYYETMSSVTESQIPNYYYIGKMQEKTPYYYKQEPTINSNNLIYANNNSSILSNTNSNKITGIIKDINENKLVVVSDKIYEIEINPNSSIFVKKSGKYIPLNNTQELRNLMNKQVELSINSDNNKLVANTIIINSQ